MNTSPSARPGKILTFLLALFVGSVFYSLIGNWLQLSLVADLVAGVEVSAEQIEVVVERQESTWLVALTMWLVTAIAFLVFVSKAIKTTQGAGVEYLSFTSGGAVLSFFIPFINIVRPYHVMQEIWRSSDPSADSTSWYGSRNSGLIKVWWGLWIASRVFGNIAMRSLDGALEYAEIEFALQVLIVSDLVDLGLTATCLFMIHSVALRLQAKWESVHGMDGLPAAKLQE